MPERAPYRQPVALVPDPPKLFEHHRMTDPSGGEANLWDDERGIRLACPMCGRNEVNNLATMRCVVALCRGRTSLWIFRRACAETRPHFHVRCTSCGWRALMDVAEPDLDVALG